MPPPPVPVVVPLNQVQGIILRGYELLNSAAFVLLEVTSGEDARKWLAGLDVTDATSKPRTAAVNVAFTWEGLKKLGLSGDREPVGFSREFQTGMDTPHRNRVLGDTGVNDPQKWVWGNQAQAARLHVLLMLYATGSTELKSLYQAQKAAFEAGRLVEVIPALTTVQLSGRKEHFGFRDGIAQPFIEGVNKADPPVHEQEPQVPGNVIKAGEILLGYNNEYDTLPLSPAIPTAGGGFLDFGRDGSYLVFRQLNQNVRAFWRFIDRATAAPGQSAADHAKAREQLAAKMVGRWRSGAPLALSPDADDPKLLNADVYGFAETDPLGVRCPIGSHTRRSNPRDALEPGPDGGRLGAAESLRVTRLHRIVRRGREYGLPVHESMEPADILTAPDTGTERDRGLHFLCFNANIARQFEFIQQTWVNNPKFGGLYADSDPIMGQRQAAAGSTPASTFTWQDDPVRHRFTGLPDFTRVRGGGYFFMPGIQAVKYLAGQPVHLKAVAEPVADPDSEGRAASPVGAAPAAAPVTPAGPLAQESPPPGEAAAMQRLAERLRAKVRRDYPTGTVRRDAHAKQHGCVRAEFVVEPDLPAELRVGVFREPRTYPAWVRFSNQDGVPQPDAKKDIRGLAIKLLGVEGEKLLDDERDARTQDFLLISTPVFVTKDVEEFDRLIRATVGGLWRLAWFFFNPFDLHWRVFRNLTKSLRRHANPLEVRYWSTTPYLFGPGRAVKYSARPLGPTDTPLPANPTDDYLRDALKQSLAGAEVRSFEFLVQFQTDPARTPIEDPGVEWGEQLSPFRKVATLRIPPQTFDSAEQMAFGEDLSFTPWHSLPDHRPLGGINRARKLVYRTISEFRHRLNQKPRVEPAAPDPGPAPSEAGPRPDAPRPQGPTRDNGSRSRRRRRR
jgi:Dyp-type peroxidase family